MAIVRLAFSSSDLSPQFIEQTAVRGAPAKPTIVRPTRCGYRGSGRRRIPGVLDSQATVLLHEGSEPHAFSRLFEDQLLSCSEQPSIEQQPHVFVIVCFPLGPGFCGRAHGRGRCGFRLRRSARCSRAGLLRRVRRCGGRS